MNKLIDLPLLDDLQTALAMLSSMLGTDVGIEGIIYNLPLAEGKLSWVYLEDAASRAELKMLKADLANVTNVQCPLLLCAKSGQSLIISFVRPGGVATAISAAGEEVTVLLADLAQQGFHSCWSVSPATTGDNRTADHIDDSKRHWLIESLWLSRTVLSSVIAATVAINILALAIPLITMNILDRVVAHAAFETLWALAIGGAIAVAGEFALRSLRGLLIDRASARADVLVLNRIFGRILGARMGAMNSSVGIQSNSLREFESLREISNSATLAALGDLPFAALFLLVIYLVAGPLVWVPLGMIPILLIAGILTQKRLQDLAIQSHRDSAHKNAVAVEVLSNLETIKAHVGENWAASKWERAVAAQLRHSLALRWSTAIGTNFIVAFQGITTIAILVCGVYLISAGEISAGALYATSMLAGRALMPVAQIAMLFSKLYHAKSAYASIRKLVDTEQERPEGRHFVACTNPFQQLTLEHIGLTYHQNDRPALTNISLHIWKGERIGIIGGIGSGKSSLLRVILGLKVPTTGNVSLDGVPVQHFEPASYRRNFGTAFRESGFFFGTIAENLRFHRPKASDAELVDAAKFSCALEWIKNLPKGFDTQIGENGAGLSGGQRQTLALTRAFLGSPPIILLDEPTSELDSRTEARFVQQLRSLSADRTLVAVTHRPAIIDVCTRLIVIDKGSVLMDGDKTIVLARLSQIVQAERAQSAAR